MLCTGADSLHVELRARVACELTLNKQYYLMPEIVSAFNEDSTLKLKNVLMAVSGQYDNSCTLSKGGNTLEKVFDRECMATAQLSCFSSMWNVHGVASVLQTSIESIYPLYNMRIRPVFHKIVKPRGSTSNCQVRRLAIMWTRQFPPREDSPWNPNHFVPCFKVQTNVSTSESVSTVSALKQPTYSLASILLHTADRSNTCDRPNRQSFSSSVCTGKKENTELDLYLEPEPKKIILDNNTCTVLDSLSLGSSTLDLTDSHAGGLITCNSNLQDAYSKSATVSVTACDTKNSCSIAYKYSSEQSGSVASSTLSSNQSIDHSVSATLTAFGNSHYSTTSSISTIPIVCTLAQSTATIPIASLLNLSKKNKQSSIVDFVSHESDMCTNFPRAIKDELINVNVSIQQPKLSSLLLHTNSITKPSTTCKLKPYFSNAKEHRMQGVKLKAEDEAMDMKKNTYTDKVQEVRHNKDKAMNSNVKRELRYEETEGEACAKGEARYKGDEWVEYNRAEDKTPRGEVTTYADEALNINSDIDRKAKKARYEESEYEAMHMDMNSEGTHNNWVNVEEYETMDEGTEVRYKGDEWVVGEDYYGDEIMNANIDIEEFEGTENEMVRYVYHVNETEDETMDKNREGTHEGLQEKQALARYINVEGTLKGEIEDKDIWYEGYGDPYAFDEPYGEEPIYDDESKNESREDSNVDVMQLKGQEYDRSEIEFEGNGNQETLPFPLLSQQWFEKQDRLLKANQARSQLRASFPVEYSEAKLLVMNRSKIQGSLEENLEAVKQERERNILQ